MKISIIGTGYVGLVSGICLAEKGHRVICVDVDREKVDKINKAIPPIYERGLEDLLKKNIELTFTATTDLKQAVEDTEISIIAVGTPFNGDKIDLTSIKQAARDLGNILKEKESYHVIVVKSTVVPGTTDEVVVPILEETSGKKAGVDFGVGMNPEFLREGEAIDDFMNPDRIVLGGIDEKTRNMMAGIYKVFEKTDVLRTNNGTAEMVKYTANALLATMISFSNEIGNLCAKLENIDVVDVLKGVQKDNRFSPILPNGERITPGFISYLSAGCGFGGSCFPKDVKALISHAKQAGSPMKLLDSVIEINEEQPEKILLLLENHFKDLDGLPVSILGLSFKPGTDDMRESPAIPIVQHLLEKGAKVQAYDPAAQQEAFKLFGNGQIQYPENLSKCIEGAKAVILLTSWDEFSQVPTLIRSGQSQPLVIDGRRMFSKNQFYNYEGIGLKRKKYQ